MYLDYRLIARDGRVVWIRDEEIVVADADGRAAAAQGYMQDMTTRRQDSIRLELLVGILSLAADETPPDEIVAAAAEQLAQLFGDVERQLRRAPRRGRLLDPLHDATRAGRSSGTNRVVGRLRPAPRSRDADRRRGHRARGLARPDPRPTGRAQRRSFRRRAAAPQRQADGRPLVQQRSGPEVGRARDLGARRRRRPARDRARERRGPRAARRAERDLRSRDAILEARSAAPPSDFLRQPVLDDAHGRSDARARRGDRRQPRVTS